MARSIHSYTNTLSYRAGDAITVHCNGEDQPVQVSLKRLVHSSDASTDIDIPWSAAGRYELRSQETGVGSFATAPIGPAPAAGLSAGCFFWLAADGLAGTRTLFSLADEERGAEVLAATVAGTTLSVAAGSDARVDLDATIRPWVWYHLSVDVDGGELAVRLVSTDTLRGGSAVALAPVAGAVRPGAPLRATVAGRNPRRIRAEAGLVNGIVDDGFTGKIEGFAVFGRALGAELGGAIATGAVRAENVPGAIAAWDFRPRSAGPDPNCVRDLVSGVAVPLVNLPTQGVTGRFFDGTEIDYRVKPEHYAAVHFHVTDVCDAGWEPLVTSRLPADLRSGVYGIEIAGTAATDVMPVFVAPPCGSDTGRKVAVVISTYCYLAYANELLFTQDDLSSAVTSGRIEVCDVDLERAGDPSFGLSMYDRHPDGSPVTYSSCRRAIVNMRRGYQTWLYQAARGFSADMYLIEWLEKRGIAYDVLTDHELHADGRAALAPYAAVITSMHPEYPTREVLDAYEGYRDGGGGLLYLGGNGWYWVTGVYSESALTVEIRRGHAGTLTCPSPPGEVTLISGEQPGGLWKYRGRPPQRLVGVGMAAQGWGKSYPFHRNAAASDPDVAWIMEGVDEDPIGDYGRVMGGAAGDEIDRADPALGTPYHAKVIATAPVRDNYYQRVREELGMTLPSPNSPGGEDDPEVHADIVYFRTPGGGEVFSAGSMAWSGAMIHDDGDNGVSRMTENVIRRFIANRS